MLLKKLLIAAGLAGTLGTASLAHADHWYPQPQPQPAPVAEPPYYGNPYGAHEGWRADENGWRGEWRRDYWRNRMEWERYRRWRRMQWMRMHGYGQYYGGW